MAPRPPMRPAMSPRMKAAKRKAENKKETVKTVKTAGKVGLGSGLATAALVASDMAHPETISRVVRKAVDDPETGGSAMRDVYEKVAGVVPPMQDIVNSAADAGVKAALIGAGATLAYKGGKRIHRALNEYQFGKR